MKSSFPCLLIVPSLLACLAGSRAAAAQASPSEPVKLIERARAITDIRVEDMPPFRLEGKIRIWVKKNLDTPAEGRYTLIWASPDKWREEVRFADYNRVRIGDRNHYWQVRSQPMELRAMAELDRTLDFPRNLQVRKGYKLEKLKEEKLNGEESACLKTYAEQRYVEKLCFDSTTGVLLYNEDWINNSLAIVPQHDYSNFQEWAGKRYPLLLRGRKDSRLLLEVQLEPIKPLAQADATLFAVPREATQWAHCQDSGTRIKNRVQPKFPPSARTAGAQGTVSIYAVVEPNGKLSNLHLVQGVDPNLNRATLDAISQWTYEPAVCGGVPSRTETFIDVIFSLQR
jgi:TonB family protein